MLLEAYFMQIDGTLNKLTTLLEYIDDTEDYINIQVSVVIIPGMYITENVEASSMIHDPDNGKVLEDHELSANQRKGPQNIHDNESCFATVPSFLFCCRYYVRCCRCCLLFDVKAAAPLEVVVGEGCRVADGRICALACLRGLCSGGFWSNLLWIGLVVVVELLMGFYCYVGGFSVLLVLRRVVMAQ
ncbi:hypothetical protein P8452_60539 [Trifolium repens]|nr:hypothetical protein P8452_60539 [Trifolium repens]